MILIDKDLIDKIAAQGKAMLTPEDISSLIESIEEEAQKSNMPIPTLMYVGQTNNNTIPMFIVNCIIAHELNEDFYVNVLPHVGKNLHNKR